MKVRVIPLVIQAQETTPKRVSEIDIAAQITECQKTVLLLPARTL